MTLVGGYNASSPIFSFINISSARANIDDYRARVSPYKFNIAPPLRHYSQPCAPSSSSEGGLTASNTTPRGVQSENPLNDNKPLIFYKDLVSMKGIIIGENTGKS